MPGAAAAWFAGAHLLRAGAASRGTDSISRSRVQAQVNQDDSQLLTVGSRVVRAGVAALSALPEVCFPYCWFGFRSYGWQRNVSPGLVQRGCGQLRWILAIAPNVNFYRCLSPFEGIFFFFIVNIQGLFFISENIWAVFYNHQIYWASVHSENNFFKS